MMMIFYVKAVPSMYGISMLCKYCALDILIMTHAYCRHNNGVSNILLYYKNRRSLTCKNVRDEQ